VTAVVLLCLQAAAACPEVEVDFRGGQWTPTRTAQLEKELGLELSRAGICGGSTRSAVLLVWEGDEPIGLAVTVRSQGTETVLRRTIDPSVIPADGLPLEVAAVVGELLREIVSPPAPPPKETPSPETAPRWALGVRASGLGSAGSLSGGGDVFARHSLGAFAVQLGVGGGAGRAPAGSAGVVEVSRAAVGVSGLLRLWGSERWALSAEAGVWGGLWWLTARAADGWTGASTDTWSVSGRAGLELTVHLQPWVLLLSGGLDAPLRPVNVTDGTERVAAVVSWAGYLTLGVALTW
jgi:hypothetical protein